MKHRSRSTQAPQVDRITLGYVRVSTDEQAESGVSLEVQKERIAACAAAMGIALAEIRCDAGASAKTLQRPGILSILRGVKDRSVGRLIILKLDRLTRSTHDLAEILELFAQSDASLVSVSESLDTQSAAGRMVVSMLGVVAQWEREAIAERTSFALAHKRNTGRVYGSTPFGYRRDGGMLIPLQDEQGAIAEAQRMDASGASYRAIAAMLTERGMKPTRGREWYGSSVRAMLQSKIRA